MAKSDPLAELVRQVLTLPSPSSSAGDSWLWERGQRVARFAEMLAGLPDHAEPANREAIRVAALFHDAGWAEQVRRGQIKHWQVLARPTSDAQLELAATVLQDKAAAVLETDLIELASDAIRQANDRHTPLLEAQIVSDASGLDDVGVTYTLRQFRQYQAEGRPLEQLLSNWNRQREYQYWDARINEGLRFEVTRQVARQRLARVQQFMDALAAEQEGEPMPGADAGGGI